MFRRLLVVGICLALVQELLAAEPPKDLKAPRQARHAAVLASDSAETPPHVSVAGRKQLESLLQSPARLDFGRRETITIKELLDQLHERHRLSIRFDMPTLATIYGASSGGPSSRPAVASHDYPLPAPLARAVLGTAPGKLIVQAVGGATPASESSSSQCPECPPAGVTLTGGAVGQSSATDSAPVPTTKLPPQPAPAAQLIPAPQVIPNAEATDASLGPAVETQRDFLSEALKTEINIQTIDLRNVSTATALRHALEALPAGDLGEEASGLPIALSNAAMLDYVVEDDGLLITSRLKALTYKETRVYSVKHLKDVKPEQLAAVIRKAVRPWSWRSRIDDLGEQLRVGGPRIPSKALAAVVKSSVQLASSETGIEVNATDAPAEKNAARPDAQNLDAQEMAMLGDALVNGLVTFVHTTLTTLEIVHYADPPTGSIQTLPGKLIITQSQAAHRDIAELLKQLAEE